jgi:sugar-specific transcriptional regulator TrmB
MEILQRIGLTKTESHLYEALLRLGESPMKDLIRSTSMHPQIVYRSIEGLVKKGLVTVTHRDSKKYAKAESPEKLRAMEEDKLADLREALPGLMKIQQLSKDAIIRVARGKDAVHSLRKRAMNELKKNDTFYVIGASGQRFYDIMGENNDSIEKKRISKGIKKKLIAFKNQREWLDKNDIWRKYAQFKYLNESYSVPSSTNIFNETVTILIWLYEPIVITIESPEVAQSYRHYFDSLWRTAKL